MISWMIAGLMLQLSGQALAVSLELFNDEEIETLKSALKALEPLINSRRQAGTVMAMTFEEMYAPLTIQEVALCEAIRQVDPASLQGSSRRLPPPAQGTEFVQLAHQAIVRQGKGIPLDTQYLPLPVYEAYLQMMAAMEKDLGKRLLVESGYRSPVYQLYLFLFYLPNHHFSIRETNQHVALPGCSEHGSPAFQAIDFITPEGINGEDEPREFEELQEYGWLQARAHEFGFALSYPRGGPSAFEPWHWHWEESKEEITPGTGQSSFETASGPRQG